MNIGQIITADVANGPGMRVSVFVSGCTNHCKGCFQPQTWNFNFGKPYTPELETYILSEIGKSYHTGLTILGGEPFEYCNQIGIIDLIRCVRNNMPDKTIWMYTGFTYETDLVPGGKRYFSDVTDEILDNIDVLVDGRFEDSLKNIRLKFKGSENQRIIDMKATRVSGQTILSDLNN